MPSTDRPAAAIVPIPWLPVLAGRLVAPPSGPHIVRVLLAAAGLGRRLGRGGLVAVILAVLVVLLSAAIPLPIVLVAGGPAGAHTHSPALQPGNSTQAACQVPMAPSVNPQPAPAHPSSLGGARLSG